MEKYKAKCAACGDYKQHFDSGIISKDGKVVHVNEEGKPWTDLKGKNKRMCPTCSGVVNKLHQLKRTCGCGRILTMKRYFNCEVCIPILEEDSDPFLEDVEI